MSVNYNLDILINVEKTGRGLEELNAATEKGATLSRTLATATGNLLSAAFTKAARAAIDFAEESNQAFEEFDAGARQIFSLIPGQSEAMKNELKADALELGAEIGRLPEETLPTLYQALSLGIPQDNIFASIEIASEAARAGNAELETTLITGQSIINAYGEDVYDLSEVYDILFAVVKNGAVTFDEINSGMSAITSVAGEAHVSLEDIGAAIITMTKQGDSFSEVSEILSNVLAQLAIDGSAAGSAFKEMAGIGFVEYIDQGHTFVDALTLMDDAAKDAGVSLLNLVGGDSPFFRDIQAARGIVELTGRHLGEMTEASNLTADSLGNTAEAAAEVADSMEIVIAKSDAATEALKVQAGEAISGLRLRWLEAKTAAAEYWATVLKNATTQRTTSEVIDDLGNSLKEQGASWWEVRQHTHELARATEYMSKSHTDAATAEAILMEADRLLRQGFEGTTAALEAKAAAAVADAAALEEETAALEAAKAAEEAAAPAHDLFANRAKGTTTAVAGLNKELLNVTKVLDGDTLKFETVDGEIQTLRFRNINTAEIDHGEGAMPFGDEALQFTQEWVNDHPIEIDAGLSRESYGRIIASVPDLEEALVREGLAIPLPATLSEDPEAAARFQEMVMEAAAAGRGMFEDQELAARVLGGELVDLGVYYEEIAARQSKLKSAYQSTIGPIDELLAAQQELAEAQGAGAEEAADRVTAAQDAIQQSYADTAIAAFEAANAGNAGAFEAFLALQVEMGNITQEAADARIEMANMTMQAEALGSSAEFAKLSTDQQANAINLLAQGLVTTADEAIRLAGSYSGSLTPELIAAADGAETLYDPLHKIGTEPFDAQITAETDQAMSAINALDGAINGLHDKTVTVTVKQVGGVSFEDFLGDDYKAPGRASGGPVSGDTLYQVGEGNLPEFLTTSTGTFMIPGDDGRVFSNQESRQALGGETVNIYIDSRGARPSEVETAVRRALQQEGRRAGAIRQGAR